MKHSAALVLVAVFANVSAGAGEIPGLPPMLPPGVEARFGLNLSNDFLGRGGSTDDFRTQQIIATADAGRWRWLADYSILTLSDPGNEGRIDQLSASLGYRVFERQWASGIDRVFAGGGLRSTGKFAGERVQNGFHRLVGSDTENLPYGDVDDTVLTGWIDAERLSLIAGRSGDWRFGYWLRGRMLATSGGQVDATAMVAAVARKGGVDAWAGLRRDWRSGYEEPVQRATAVAEDDLAAAIGVRLGSFVLETVQQFDNDASFGQLRLLSLEADAGAATATERIGLDTGVVLPDVHWRMAGRLSTRRFAGSGWRAAWTGTLDFGEPQFGDDPTLYVESRQLGIGMEWARTLSGDSGWLSGYAGAGVGYRDERVVGDGDRADQRSARVGRGVILLSAGLRFSASALGAGWRYRIQTGIAAWLPWSDATVTVGADRLTIQEPSVALLLGVSFERH